MATTFVDYTGDGQNNKAFSFPSFQESDVKVEVENVIKTTATHYNISSYSTSGGGTIVFTSGNIPTAGQAIRIYRDTDISTTSGEYDPKATFTAGSSVKAADLNNNQKQALYAIEEEKNQTITATDIKDGSITSAKIANGTIVDADINASAAITQSKIALDADLTALSSMQTGAAAKVALLTATEVETLDGITASTAELNKLDGVTATTAELNYTDGVTSNIQTQLDAKQTTNAKITELGTMSTGTAEALADLTGTEVQILDGVTATTAELNRLDGITSSTAELNLLDGVQSSAVELNVLDGITATTAELNYVDGVTSAVQTQLDAKQTTNAKITELGTMAQDTANALADLTQAEVQTVDGITASTAELNKLDGVTSTTDNLNIVSGMTKQTTISDQDTSYPTSGAVVDYVAAQIAPIGGLEVIANEVSFPATQPAAGVVISIGDCRTGVVVNGSGTATIANAAGSGVTVTINNFPSSLHSYTLTDDTGLMVSSTGSGHIYNYHKYLGKETDIKQLSSDIDDFANRYRVQSGEPGSNNDEGDLVFDTAANKMKVYDGSSWGEVASTGEFKYLVLCDAGTTNAATYGSATSYDLKENSTSGSAASITNAAQLLVSVNGVIQKANTGTSTPAEGFVMADADTIKFSTAPPANSNVFVVQIGAATTLNTPADNTVTAGKLDLSIVQGDVIYGTGNDAWAKLAKGTAGQVLKMNSGATAPEWATDATVADTNTTYSISCVDGDNTDEEKIRLTAGGSGSGTDDIVLEAGTGLSIARSSDKITFTNTVSNTDTQLTEEQVEDFVGGMVTGNTETGITVTYEDSDGTLDFVVDDTTKLPLAGGTMTGVSTFNAAAIGEVTALTDGATIATDLALSNNFSVTLAGNRTLGQPTNQVAGQSGSIFITQDGTGSRTLAYHADFKWVGGTAPTLTTTAAAVDRIDYVVAAANKIHAVASLDVK